MTPFEKKLLLALTPENKVSQEEIIEKLVSIYKTFYLFDGKKHIRKPLMLHFTGTAARLLTRIMPAQLVKTDRVVVMRSSQADSSQNGIMQNKSSSHMILKKEETDHAYIEKLLWKVTVFKTGTGKDREKNSVKEITQAATYGLRMENIFQKRKYQQKTVI